MPGEQEEPRDGSVPADESSGAYDSAVDAGGIIPPFVPGREPLYYSSSGDDPPPEVIVDQVAGLASHAVELPPITDFLYDEPEPDALAESGYGPLTGEHAPGELAGQTPAYGSPGMTPAYGSPGMTPSHGGARQTPVHGGQWQTPAHGAPTPPAAYGTGQARPAYGARIETPSRSTPVPPLPGFTPARGTPAVPMPMDPRLSPSRGSGFQGPPPGHPAPPQPQPPQGIEPWATGEWQRYDWRAAAALGPEERARAAQAWSDLDWEGDARGRAIQRNDEIAAALEEIARRVRAGELHVHGHAGMSAEAAAAAALAALLAKRT